jgi:hypothetical protein
LQDTLGHVAPAKKAKKIIILAMIRPSSLAPSFGLVSRRFAHRF